ncbi:glycosyltransferase [Paenibacillus sp. M1]|uniref:Glycosyltransferase n=1 Tax=Paenibacillus haidiansis TaxID=1574488 RepID=A0ABU7VTS3_9BACL
MMTKFLKFMLVCLLLVGVAVPGNAQAEEKGKPSAKEGACISPAALQLSNEMRKLWIEHVLWTHGYIVSAVDGLQDQGQVLARLLRNQQDIGNAVKPYYGEAAGNHLAKLLTEHIIIAGKIVDAAKAGNQKEVDKLNKIWFRNADEIVKYFNKLNPYWTVKELQPLYYRHLQLVTDDAVTRIKKDWEGNIRAFDQGRDHITLLADALTRGLIAQFPDKFK